MCKGGRSPILDLPVIKVRMIITIGKQGLGLYREHPCLVVNDVRQQLPERLSLLNR